MEIKPVPKIIEDIGKLVQEEKYEEACSFGLENIDLNKKYIEGEYAQKGRNQAKISFDAGLFKPLCRLWNRTL